MEDIAPQLLETLRSRFSEKVSVNPKIRALMKKIKDGNATYADAEDYAYLVGQALADVFRENLSSAMLPDGRMYYNIAERVLRPLLEDNHTLVSVAAARVQTSLNQKANLGIKAQTVAVNNDRVYGIVNKVSEAESYDDVAWVLDEPVKNFSMNVVDETLRENVEFQGRAGLRPKVIRRAERKCCKWCSELVGTYAYPVVGDEVYKRHERCRCVVEYDPGSGRRQDVHTKKWTDEAEPATMIKRRVIGLRAGKISVQKISDHAMQRIQERNVTLEAVQDALAHPLKTSEVKYDSEGRPSITLIGEKATVAINPETGAICTVHPTHSKTARKLKGKK